MGQAHRRKFLIGASALLAAPLAGAQAPGKLFRLGILRQTLASDPLTTVMRQALRETGYLEGRNIAVEWRYAAGQVDRLPPLGAELVKLNPDALATGGDLSIRALR